MRKLVCLWALLFLPLLAQAGQSEDEMIAKALDASGVSEELEEITLSLQNGLRQRASEGVALHALSYPELSELIDRYYSKQAIREQVVSVLSEKFDLNRYALLLRILESEQVTMINKRMAVARTDESFDALQAFASEIKKHPLEKRREGLLKELDGASAATEFFTGSQALGMAALLGMLDVVNHPKSESTLSENLLLQQFYGQLQEPSRYTVKMRQAFALQDLSDDEIKMSVRVYKGTVVQWFLGEAMNGMVDAMSQIRKEVLEEIKRLKEQQKRKV